MIYKLLVRKLGNYEYSTEIETISGEIYLRDYRDDEMTDIVLIEKHQLEDFFKIIKEIEEELNNDNS